MQSDSPVIILRDYQEEMRDATIDNIFAKKHRGTLVVAPMGCGKSLTMAATACMAADRQGRGVLIVAHLRGLVRGNAKAVRQLGRKCYFYYGFEKDVVWSDVKNGAIVSASIQALSPRATESMPKDAFCAILIDEGHHAVLKSAYERVAKHFGCPVVLYTATPDRDDGEPLASDHALCESVAYNGQVKTFVKNGWILRPYVRYDVATKLDWTVISDDGKEVTEQECQRIWEAHKSDYAVIKPMLEKHDGMQTVAFAPSVKLAKLWAELVNDELPNMAQYIASYRPCDYTSAKMEYLTDDRNDAEEAFRWSRLRFLFNKGVFLEGADLVAAQLCMIGIFTKSRSKYAQIVGRVLRPGEVWCPIQGYWRSVIAGMEKASAAERLKAIAESHKKHAVILDYGGTSGSSKLAHPVSLFCDDHEIEPEVKKIAKAIIDEQAKKGRDVDVENAIMDAEEKYKTFLVNDAKVRRSIAVACETVTREIDPFEGNDVTGKQRYKPRKVNPPSPKIVENIRKYTKELGLSYSDQFYRELTAPKSFAVMKQLRAKVDTKRQAMPCPGWVITKLEAAGCYEAQPNYYQGLKALQEKT